MPASLSKPYNYYVRGRDLVLGEYTPPGKVGDIPMFLHQTWKSEYMKKHYVDSFDNWSKLHPGFLHVLWTDEDNDLLVTTHFPEFLPAYKWLPLIIQQTDFVRLMYLYKYGGIYADLDYEVYQPLVPCLPQLCGFMAVESPFSLNECMQNSLMISSAGHPVVAEALNIINQSVFDLRRKKYKGISLKNKFIGPLMSTFLTLGLTGPQVLDKAVTRMSTLTQLVANSGLMDAALTHPAAQGTISARGAKDLQVARLNEQFFKGPVAAHLQHNTWVEDLPKKCTPLILLVTFILVFLMLLVAVITFCATKFRK